MSSPNEKSSIAIEFRPNNYGTNENCTSNCNNNDVIGGTLYCLHGQNNIEVRGHCHKNRIEGVDIKARKKLIIASVLCVIFMIAEIIGGIMSNSLAIATDAAHLLTDFASFMISLFAIWVAGRPSTKRLSFGYWRAEVIGALASVVMIWFITAILIWLAVERIINKTYEVDAKIMLITSGLAILVNVIMGIQLGHGHSHGGSSSPQDGSHSHDVNINVRAHLSTILKDALMVLMEGTPSYLQYTEVLQIFEQIEGVERVHNLRIWALSLNKVALSVHLAIRSDTNPKHILDQATSAVHVKYHFYETTIQIEDYIPEMEDCQQCSGPKK
uniref:Cation efflux protein transmembrane domain-containing protein n=1 Tax=Megaselia scalaris TaxID=36166 RepID=T1H4L5_MEGSC